MSQSASLWVYLIFSICLITTPRVLLTTHAVTAEETLCGSASVKGPVNEIGHTGPLLKVEASLCSENSIVIRCQLNRTDTNVNYKKRLRIYFPRDIDDAKDYYTIRPGQDNPKFKYALNDSATEGSNIIKYNFTIAVDPRLERSIIICGAGYEISSGNHKYCYTGTAALIIFQDHNRPCTTSTAPPEISSTNTTETPMTPAFTEAKLAINKDTLFSVVGTVILVGIILVVLNCIQLWVIIIIMKKKRVAKAVNISATNGIALDHLNAELEQHDTDTDKDVSCVLHV